MKTNAEPEIVTKNGKPVSVILPIEDYQKMLERLEDCRRRSMAKTRPTQEASPPSIGGSAC